MTVTAFVLVLTTSAYTVCPYDASSLSLSYIWTTTSLVPKLCVYITDDVLVLPSVAITLSDPADGVAVVTLVNCPRALTVITGIAVAEP